MEFCNEHGLIRQSLGEIKAQNENTQSGIERLDKRINGSFDRIAKHVDEGEGIGGFRERLVKLEQIVFLASKEKLNSQKSAQWRVGIIAGLPGSVLALCKIIDWLIKR